MFDLIIPTWIYRTIHLNSSEIKRTRAGRTLFPLLDVITHLLTYLGSSLMDVTT
jgi:hypothetical protein